jgi:hypothetical protein
MGLPTARKKRAAKLSSASSAKCAERKSARRFLDVRTRINSQALLKGASRTRLAGGFESAHGPAACQRLSHCFQAAGDFSTLPLVERKMLFYRSAAGHGV